MPKAADASRRSPSQRVASGSKLATLLTDEKTLQDPQNQDSEIEPGYQYDDALLVADTSAYDSAASRAVFSSGHSHDEASSSSKQDSASSNRKGSLALLLSPTLPDDEDRPPMSALDYFGGSTSPLIHESHEIRSDSSPFQNNLAPEPPVEPVASAVESQQVASIPTRSKIKYNPTRKTGSTAAFRKPITLAEWRALDKSSVNPLRPTISGEDPRERIFMQAGAMENGSSHEPLSRPTTPPLPATSNVSTRESTQYVPPPMPDIAAIAAGLIPVGSGMSARPQAPALPSPASHSRETGRRPSSKRPFTPGGYNGEPPAKRSKTTLVKTEDTVRSADAMNVAKHCGCLLSNFCPYHYFMHFVQIDNIRPNLGVDQRQLSPIIGLRSFNNWIKTVLINKYCKSPPEMMAEAAMINGHQDRRSVIQRRNLKVLDMGCGKGGDLMKWNQVGVSEYYGVGMLTLLPYSLKAFAERQADIADVSINQAISRIQSSHLRFDAKFYVADCYSVRILLSFDMNKARGSYQLYRIH